MLRSSKKLGQSKLSRKIDSRSRTYSIAAAAAGVSLLAMAQPADAEVVITRKTIPIPVSSYFGEQHIVPISLNNSGVTDFSFSLYSFAYHGFNQTLNVVPAEGGAVVAAPSPRGGSFAAALVRGAKIGSSAQFGSKRVDIEQAEGFDASSKYSRNLYGNWGDNPANRFLGVRFLIDGETHYGWVRLTVTTEPRGFSAEITAYAYETIANKRILAGVSGTSSVAEARPQSIEPSSERASLGMLAVGANGLALWRREQTSASN